LCINNSKQVNLALQTYCEDHQDILPLTNKVRFYYVFLAGFPDVEIGPPPLQLPHKFHFAGAAKRFTASMNAGD
jgi:hypothetical protein